MGNCELFCVIGVFAVENGQTDRLKPDICHAEELGLKREPAIGGISSEGSDRTCQIFPEDGWVGGE